jgi:hypothetical protein
MAMGSQDIREASRAVPDGWLRQRLADRVTRLEDEAAACATPLVIVESVRRGPGAALDGLARAIRSHASRVALTPGI